MSKFRNFIFTFHNYDAENKIATKTTILESLTNDTRYYTYGRETCPDTGTPHWQGYVCWRHPKSIARTRVLLPGCHVEVRGGTHTQAKEYSQKDGDFEEAGIPPQERECTGQREVARWENAWESARTGDIEAIPADIRIRCYATLRRIGQDYLPRVDNLADVCGTWVHGASGTGKSRSVLAKYPECFPKPLTIWWTGYQLEETVLLDDIDTFNVSLGGLLKQWADFKPFIGQIHGGSQKIRPKRFLVTSQYTIEEIWSDRATRDALNRRFKSVLKTEDNDISEEI
nr:MAG: replication associated protein [Cressdnaviricota sp.]